VAAGVAEAGGLAGPKLDFNANPEGDVAVAKRYLERAGYASGSYSGGGGYANSRKSTPASSSEGPDMVDLVCRPFCFRVADHRLPRVTWRPILV